MSSLLSILGALLLLSILVTVHELGHFLVGRKLGFTILEFAIGMGPAVWKTEKNGITYALRAFPIGGMCRFYGEDEGISDQRCFNAHPAWHRAAVVAAGPIMNLIMAILFAILSVGIYGVIAPEIYEISDENTPAAIAGVQVGDVLTAIDGQPIDFYNDAVSMIRSVSGNQAVLTVRRNNTEVDLVLKDFYNAELGYNYLGVTLTPMRMHYGVQHVLRYSFRYVGSIVRETFGFFGSLFRGQVQSTDVAGPVGTIAYISEAVRYGMEVVLQFAVLINISLGIFNLIPLPALDGGRLLFLLIEIVRGKPIDQEKEGMVHFVGIMLLFGLIIFLTYNDVLNLIRR